MRTTRFLVAALLPIAAACALTTDTTDSSDLLAAFQSAPFGMSDLSTTFATSSDQEGTPWAPPGRPGHEFDHHGPPGGPMGFMMGGLRGGFLGSLFGPHFGNRPVSEDGDGGSCSFDAGSGRVECDPVTRGGLTIVRSAQYLDANGAVQSGFDDSDHEFH